MLSWLAFCSIYSNFPPQSSRNSSEAIWYHASSSSGSYSSSSESVISSPSYSDTSKSSTFSSLMRAPKYALTLDLCQYGHFPFSWSLHLPVCTKFMQLAFQLRLVVTLLDDGLPTLDFPTHWGLVVSAMLALGVPLGGLVGCLSCAIVFILFLYCSCSLVNVLMKESIPLFSMYQFLDSWDIPLTKNAILNISITSPGASGVLCCFLASSARVSISPRRAVSSGLMWLPNSAKYLLISVGPSPFCLTDESWISESTIWNEFSLVSHVFITFHMTLPSVSPSPLCDLSSWCDDGVVKFIIKLTAVAIGISTSSPHSLWPRALSPLSFGSFRWSNVAYCSSDRFTTPHAKLARRFCSTIGLRLCHCAHLSGEWRSIGVQFVLGGSTVRLAAMVIGVNVGVMVARNFCTISFMLSGLLTHCCHGRGASPLFHASTIAFSFRHSG